MIDETLRDAYELAAQLVRARFPDATRAEITGKIGHLLVRAADSRRPISGACVVESYDASWRDRSVRQNAERLAVRLPGRTDNGRGKYVFVVLEEATP